MLVYRTEEGCSERSNFLGKQLDSSCVALHAEDVVVERAAALALAAGGEKEAAVLALVALDVEAAIQGNHSNCFFKA